jgi:hypothetical protein
MASSQASALQTPRQSSFLASWFPQRLRRAAGSCRARRRPYPASATCGAGSYGTISSIPSFSAPLQSQ